MKFHNILQNNHCAFAPGKKIKQIAPFQGRRGRFRRSLRSRRNGDGQVEYNKGKDGRRWRLQQIVSPLARRPSSPFYDIPFRSTIPLPMIGGNGTSTAPPASIIIHSARVLKGRTPSNLRQGLLRPQSGVGTRNCKGVLKARYSSFSRNSRPFAVKKLINNLLTGFRQRENLVSCPLSIKKCKF